ncbi:hypothetical protein CP965_07360 [Halarcobacter mediterraneus]|uniref:Uncharacterized protein n=1 Tax=Halarcobacter mediterraneus TaxID=2023153 RepID=A0A4Q1AVV6_9BACT|nr:hypothetical protein [Halarcobacter mediterraneus]RXK13606.1 hypothetical protein CP965_07360 [Halarcobacter mediterraneus]
MRALIVHDFIVSNYYYGEYSFLELILKRLLKNVTYANPNNFNFSRAKLFNLMGKVSSKEKYIEVNIEDLNKESLNYIKSYIEGFDILITFELSSTSKKIFESLNIKYLDIWVSPIRFHKDIMFSFYSNKKSIQEKLDKFQISEKKLFKRANKLSNYIKNFSPLEINLTENSALIIGQLKYDKSVMKNGKFLTLLDFKNTLNKISKNYKKLYFLKHPLMKENEYKELFNELKSNGSIEFLNDINIYKLLTSKEINEVIGISSSVLTEAKYFNKKVRFLYKPVIPQKYKLIYKKIYKSEFWKTILDLNSEEKFDYLVHDNYLRYSSNVYYGYKEFLNDNHIFKTYQEFIDYIKFIESLDNGNNYILYGFGTLGKLILSLLDKVVYGVIDKNLNDNYILYRNNKIPKVNIDDLKRNDNLIVSPFLYNKEIKNELKDIKCNIIYYKN